MMSDYRFLTDSEIVEGGGPDSWSLQNQLDCIQFGLETEEEIGEHQEREHAGRRTQTRPQEQGRHLTLQEQIQTLTNGAKPSDERTEA